MQWAGAAERHQHELARIVATLDRYHADRAQHGVVDDLQDAARRLVDRQAERTGDLTFTPHPATRIVRSRFAAVTIFAANRSPDPFERINAGEPEDGLITRPGFEVVVRDICQLEGPTFSRR